MNLEQQIAALCAEAEPLRCLPDEEAEARGLPQLVERINLLRSMQMTQGAGMHQEAPAVSDKPRRGRPPKAKLEGADA